MQLGLICIRSRNRGSFVGAGVCSDRLTRSLYLLEEGARTHSMGQRTSRSLSCTDAVPNASPALLSRMSTCIHGHCHMFLVSLHAATAGLSVPGQRACASTVSPSLGPRSPQPASRRCGE